MNSKKCAVCHKRFSSAYKQAKYCSRECWRINRRISVNKAVKKHYMKNRDRILSGRKGYSRKWYSNNKEKQFERVYKNSKRYSKQRRVRNFCYYNKIYLLGALGRKCSECGSKKNISFHHTSYDFDNSGNKEDKLKRMLEITLVLCRRCHGLIHRSFP